MKNTENASFVPILNVLCEGGPFIWIVSRPDEMGVGPCLCDLMGWDESMPLSEALFQKFSDWMVAQYHAEGDAGYSTDLGDDWDWVAFHARGLQLSRWLKEEVGDEYRVVYIKYGMDPNHAVDERREVLADGSLAPLPPFQRRFPAPPCFCERIISGGQTGVDRAALDFAIQHEYPHGGWAPHGRKAENGRIPVKYQLTELAEGGYIERTCRNVEDSDGTLLINLGELEGGSLNTKNFAEKLNKPHLVVQLNAGVTDDAAASVLAWLRANAIKTLNVAGPRESKRPGIYRLTMELLQAVDALLKKSLDKNTQQEAAPDM